jgi:hypothetical protein
MKTSFLGVILPVFGSECQCVLCAKMGNRNDRFLCPLSHRNAQGYGFIPQSLMVLSSLKLARISPLGLHA